MVVEDKREHTIVHYSDRNMHIRQIETGKIYENAVDIIPCEYTYEETDDPIISYPDEMIDEPDDHMLTDLYKG